MARKPRTAPQAARVRAARAYADLNQPQIAAALSFSHRDWARVEAGEKALDPAQLEQLAELCHVPLAFLNDGFGAQTDLDRLLSHFRAFEEFAHRTTDQALSQRNAIFGEVRHRLAGVEDAQHSFAAAIERIEDALAPISAFSEALADEMDLRSAARAINQVAVDLLDSDARAAEAERDTPQPSDATQEGSPAPSEERRSSG